MLKEIKAFATLTFIFMLFFLSLYIHIFYFLTIFLGSKVIHEMEINSMVRSYVICMSENWLPYLNLLLFYFLSQNEHSFMLYYELVNKHWKMNIVHWLLFKATLFYFI